VLTLHLVALGFLRFAVVGGAIHILPTLLRTSDSCWRPADGAASPLRAAGPVLAYGIAHDQRLACSGQRSSSAPRSPRSTRRIECSAAAEAPTRVPILDCGREGAVVSNGAEHALRRHRALGEPSRVRILDELVDHGPLGAQELAERVRLHPNTVRAHLNALAAVGLVEADKGVSERRGRPRFVYRATGVEEAGRRYRLLAEILTAVLAGGAADGDAALEEAGERWGRHIVDSPPPFAKLSEEEAVERLVLLLRETGFSPEVAAGERDRQILMRTCPFLELAQRQRDIVCPIHLGLMRGALAELGASSSVSKLEPFVRPDLCVAHLSAPR
jgi:predicted ArsR family transcriptional regulator